MKGVKDSSPLYVLSEMAQVVIQEKATACGWSLPSYGGKMTMPVELFERLSSSAAAETLKKVVY